MLIGTVPSTANIVTTPTHILKCKWVYSGYSIQSQYMVYLAPQLILRGVCW